MAGERIDYTIERQRHESFVGRDEIVAQLDELLVTDPADRSVLITGGPGRGKSALLTWWLMKRERAGEPVPYHFIRRAEYDWDDPARLVGSLIWQIEQRFPAQHEPDTDARLLPAARLGAMLQRVSAGELVPGGRRLVLVIDGLDEHDPAPGEPAADPLAPFLPGALPRGVSLLCAARSGHGSVAALEARGGVVRIDLEDPAHADNPAAVRRYWEMAVPPLGLGPIFVTEAVRRAEGNLQHATMLRRYVAGLPSAQRRVKAIPGGLETLLGKLWERVMTDPVAVLGFGLLCAARQALTLEELGAAAEWTDEAARRRFAWSARELLAETWRPDGPREYRLHHESVRDHIATTLGLAALRVHHGRLARRLAPWPPPADPALRRYALRHGLAHRAAAGDWVDAWQLASDASFLEAKRRELGARDTAADLARIAGRARAAGNAPVADRFEELARTLAAEAT